MGGLGAGDGGSAKNLQRSHAVHSCLPPAAPPPPHLAVPSICPPPLSLHTSGVACLARWYGCLLGWWRDGGGGGGGVFRGRWRAIE